MAIQRAKPIAQQVKDILQGRIVEGEYTPDERMPSETDLAAEFGVSRSTIRAALSQLAAKGLITRKTGDGTYINEAILRFSQQEANLWEFSRHIESTGRVASIRNLWFQMRQATAEEAASLDLIPGDRVLAYANIFLANGKPVCLAHNLIPARIFSCKVGKRDLQVPFDEFIEKCCTRQLGYATLALSAAAAEKETASALHLASGKPLLRIDVVFYDTENLPVASTHSFYAEQASRMRIPIALE